MRAFYWDVTRIPYNSPIKSGQFGGFIMSTELCSHHHQPFQSISVPPPQEEALYPWAVISCSFPTPPHPQPCATHQRTLCLHRFVCSGCFLWMAAFTEHRAFRVPSHHSRCQHSIPFHVQVMFHGVDLPHSIYLLFVVCLWDKFLAVGCWIKW